MVVVGYFDDEQRHRILVDKCKDGTCGEYALLWDSSACCFTGGHALDTQAVPTVVWGDVA